MEHFAVATLHIVVVHQTLKVVVIVVLVDVVEVNLSTYLSTLGLHWLGTIHKENGPNGLNWQSCLASSSKRARRILIFSMAMGANYTFELISIKTCAPQFK